MKSGFSFNCLTTHGNLISSIYASKNLLLCKNMSDPCAYGRRKTRAYVRICRNNYTHNKIRATDCSTHTIPEKWSQEFVRTGKGIYHTPKALLQGYIYVVTGMFYDCSTRTRWQNTIAAGNCRIHSWYTVELRLSSISVWYVVFWCFFRLLIFQKNTFVQDGRLIHAQASGKFYTNFVWRICCGHPSK